MKVCLRHGEYAGVCFQCFHETVAGWNIEIESKLKYTTPMIACPIHGPYRPGAADCPGCAILTAKAPDAHESDMSGNPWRDIKTDPPQDSDFDDIPWRNVESQRPGAGISYDSPAHRGHSTDDPKWRHTARWLEMHRNSAQCVDCGQPHGWGGTYIGPQRCPACVEKLSTPKPSLDPRPERLLRCPKHGSLFKPGTSCTYCAEEAIDEARAETSLDPKAAAGKLKAPLWLNPPAAEEAMAFALQLGITKGYSAWNWRKVKVLRSTYISAMKRHINRVADGEEIDPESGAHHLGHVMANCAIILDAARHGTLVIDGEEGGA